MQRTHVCGTQRNREANFGFQVKNILCRIPEPTLQLLMPESHGCPFDSDSDPKSYDIHAGSS
jgi:hypothetical protein